MGKEGRSGKGTGSEVVVVAAEVDAQEEGGGGGVGELLGLEDVEVVPEEEGGYAVDYAGAVGTGEGELWMWLVIGGDGRKW